MEKTERKMENTEREIDNTDSSSNRDKVRQEIDRQKDKKWYERKI